jgi:hypothetical protein
VPEVVRLAGNDTFYGSERAIANVDLFVKQYIRDLLPVESRAGATAPIPIP